MSISDLSLYSSVSSALDNALNNLQTTEEQLSTGKSVNQPSDNPTAYAESQLLGTQETILTNDQTLASTVQSQLTSTASALTQVSNDVQSAQTIATEGANGTVSASDMQAMAQQVQGILANVINSANFSYNGAYVFGGDQVSAPPYNSTGAYSGDANGNSVTFSNGTQVQLTFNGQAIFGDSSTGLIGTLTSLISALQAGNQSAVSSALPQLQTALQQVAEANSSVGVGSQSATNISNNTATEITSLTGAQQNLVGANIAQDALQVQQLQLQEEALVSLGSDLGQMPLINVLV